MAPTATRLPPRIVIAGGGLAGLALGLALKQGLTDDVSVTICDPALSRDPSDDKRAYAVAAAGRRMFQALGIWSVVADRAQPITDMVITDSRLHDPVRPTFLTFDGTVEDGEPFAHMVMSGDLTAALMEASRAAGVELSPVPAVSFQAGTEGIVIQAGGENVKAALLVAADGGRSKLREQAGIGWIAWPYRQSAIVATIAHERDHGGRAIEHFMPSGPFAILPLKADPNEEDLPFRSSIVWTEKTGAADGLLVMSPEAQRDELERRFGFQLGRIAFYTAPAAFPLSFGIARSLVSDRIALLGDAAHVIHPIAGQGLNLAMHDAAALAEIIADGMRLSLDPGTPDVLEQYERARRTSITAMGVMTDGLNRLFSNDALPVRLIRDLGLGLVDRMPSLKRFFIQEAAGDTSRETPRLLRGEAL